MCRANNTTATGAGAAQQKAEFSTSDGAAHAAGAHHGLTVEDAAEPGQQGTAADLLQGLQRPSSVDATSHTSSFGFSTQGIAPHAQVQGSAHADCDPL